MNRRVLVKSVVLPTAVRNVSAAVTAAERQADRWTPAQGLRVAGPAFPVTTLDPALSRDLPTLFVVRQIFRGLLKFDASLNAVSDLADLVEASSDEAHFTFRLRDDAAFADGRPLTSQDVVASYSRALNSATAGGSVDGLGAAPYLRDIRGAEDVLAGRSTQLGGLTIVDNRTLTIDLEASSSTFLLRLASVATAIVDVNETRENSAWWHAPNATGPFTIASFAAEAIELVPNAAYIGPVPQIPSVKMLTGTAAANPFNLYQRGDVDLVPAAASSAALAADPASGIDATVDRTPLFVTCFIALGNQQPPLDDVHVRRALARLLSPQLVAATMFSSAVEPAAGLIPPGMLGRDWPGKVVGQDLAAARDELAASRYGDAPSVPAIHIFAADIEPVEALRDTAAELGLTIDAVEVNWTDFLSGLVRRRFPAYSLYWGADYPDPAAFLEMLFRSDGSDNYTGYSNPSFDSLLAQTRRESDVERRAALYLEAQNLLLDDGAVIPLYHDVSVSLARPGVGGLVLTPMGTLGLETVTRTP